MRKRKYTALAQTGIQHAPVEDALGDTPLPTIHNVVSTAQIEANCMPLDLETIGEVIPGASYDKKRFAAMTIRMHNPTCTILLFSSGKMVVTGGKCWYESMCACLFLKRMLQERLVGTDFLVRKCTIENIVAHVEIKLPEDQQLDLDSMYTKLNIHCTYNKKMFPGLIFRPEACPVVLLCFHSGKIVITGGKSTTDVNRGWKMLWPTVHAFITKK
jgi:transcription initiation factor TFIID TATA-box-binding protein